MSKPRTILDQMLNSTITFVMAPSIPKAELPALRNYMTKVSTDPDYLVVTNYDVQVVRAYVPAGRRLLVTAPGIPAKETKDLRKQVKRALINPEKWPVVVNYGLVATVI